MNENSYNAERRDRIVEVIRVYWKTRKKVGFVKWTDDFGFDHEKLVEEGYEKAEHEDLVWKWVNEHLIVTGKPTFFLVFQ